MLPFPSGDNGLAWGTPVPLAPSGAGLFIFIFSPYCIATLSSGAGNGSRNWNDEIGSSDYFSESHGVTAVFEKLWSESEFGPGCTKQATGNRVHVCFWVICFCHPSPPKRALRFTEDQGGLILHYCTFWGFLCILGGVWGAVYSPHWISPTGQSLHFHSLWIGGYFCDDCKWTKTSLFKPAKPAEITFWGFSKALWPLFGAWKGCDVPAGWNRAL